MELKDIEDLREKGEVFQVKTPPPGYKSPEEIPLEVGLHFIVFKYVFGLFFFFFFLTFWYAKIEAGIKEKECVWVGSEKENEE